MNRPHSGKRGKQASLHKTRDSSAPSLVPVKQIVKLWFHNAEQEPALLSGREAPADRFCLSPSCCLG